MLFYIALAVIVIGIAFLSAILYVKQKKLQMLDELKGRWGKVKHDNTIPDNVEFHSISRYATANPVKETKPLPSQLTGDIDFMQLFCFLDRTTSKIGQQFLFRKLLFPLNDKSALQDFNKLAEFYRINESSRSKVQMELLRLSHRHAYLIPNLLRRRIAERPAWFYFGLISIPSFVAFIVLSFWNPVYFILLLLPAGTNLAIHYWNKNNIFQFAASIPQLTLLISVADKLSKLIATESIPNQDQVPTESIRVLSLVGRKFRLIELTPLSGLHDDLSQIASPFVELLKGIFLIEFYSFFTIAKDLEEHSHHIETIFDFVGEIDAAISVASLRTGGMSTCTPEFIKSETEFVVRDVVHPLVTRCVPNSIEVSGNGVLITGSNMSGKTTFLRSILINSILAQTIYTCFASEFRSPFLRQWSFIRIDDDLTTKTSYFLQEVKLAKQFVDAAESSQLNLFVLDELFKGTNTIERVAAAKAMLSFLQRTNNLVFISTHDLELLDLLGDSFDFYHFTEIIENNELRFDHKLKPGVLKTRNAINILKIHNFPSEITEEALTLSRSLATVRVDS